VSRTRIFHAVTTCSKLGYEQYGKRMLESLRQFWPDKVDVTLYSEDVPDAKPLPDWLHEFKARHAKNKAANGKGSHGRFMGQYNYRFDAVRFAHKTAAVIDAAERMTAERSADVLIWIDADTVTHAPVTVEFLRSLSPSTGDDIAWLWRTKTYPECGFYMLNLTKPSVAQLIREWKALYTSDMLFQLPEWHDSYVLKELVRSLGCNWTSLSGDSANTSHPFVNGPLGAVMDHMKGARKLVGHSKARDLVNGPRAEAYWKGIK
jgi:hypothetical protein